MTGRVPRWEELLSLAVEKKGDEGALLNDLLSAFRGGFPIERLKVLLDHDDPDVVREGAWILSELGARARPLASYLPSLVRHSVRWVRIYAIDAVLTCASSDDGELVAATLKLAEDADDGVRWMAVEFLARAPEALLRGAVHFLDETSEMRRALTTLLDGSSDDVRGLLRDAASALRRVGIAASRRRRDVVALEEAKASNDEETRTLAAGALEYIRREEYWAQREASRATRRKNPGRERS